jgi:bacterioferritin
MVKGDFRIKEQVMGTAGKKIVGMDVDMLVKELNKAFADEWLAYYQYWIGAKVAKGPMRDHIVMELEEHAAEELNHAMMLQARIIQLGGTPLLTPTDWTKWANCGYETPSDPYTEVLLQQNIKGEQCAIGVYKRLIDMTMDTDPVTYNILVTILTDEVTHEEDLQAIMEDLKLMQMRTMPTAV